MASTTAAQSATELNSPLRLVPAAPKRAKAPIVAGALLILVSAFLFGNASLRAGQRVAVIAIDRPVAAGHVVEASDLKTVRVASDGGIAPIKASRMSSVIGKPAAVALVPGTLLTESALGASTALTIADAQVGMALKPGLFPPGLAVGATVRIIGTDAGVNATLVDTATVMSVSDADSSGAGTTTIGLRIPAVSANAVAGSAAAGHVTLVEVAAP